MNTSIVAVLWAMSLSAPSPDPTSLLQSLKSLDRQLVKLEGELTTLKGQESKLQEEIASLDIALSETGLKQVKVTEDLQKRVRALNNMPGGARMIALGNTNSLKDYLELSRMLRWVANHDQKLKNQHQEAAAKNQLLKTKRQSSLGILSEISADIKVQRENLGRKRRSRIETTQTLLSSATNLEILSGAHLQAYQRLENTFRKLKPLTGLSRVFAQNRKALPWPLIAPVEVGYGTVRELAYGTKLTNFGLLLKPASGTPVQSVFDGTVVYADWLDGYGQLVIVDHGYGYHSLYGHLATVEVKTGQTLKTSTTIGTAGDTGSWAGTRLYFEIRSQGQAQDPMLWLRR
jgi:septal ring factor EnvC (AmiA/AmiB activator)